MKKLIITGYKDTKNTNEVQKKIFASIYVQNKKVVVNSPFIEFKNLVEKKISSLQKDNLLFVRSFAVEKKTNISKGTQFIEHQKPGDDKFLHAVAKSAFWSDFSLNGYSFSSLLFKIIDE
jgi:type III secretory pathway lipoprotein EscJ